MWAVKQRKSGESLLRDLQKLFRYVSRAHKRQLGFLVILMVISSLSEIVSLGATVPFLTALGNAESLLLNSTFEPLFTLLNIETAAQLVVVLAIVFISAVIVANGLRILTINVQTHLAATISSDLSCQLYKKTLLQSYSFHSQHNSSDLIHAVTGDTRLLTNHILIPLLALITNSLVVMSLIGGLFLIDAQVAIISTVLLGSAYVCIYTLRRTLLRRNSQSLVRSSQQQIKVIQESLGGIQDVLLGSTQGFYQSAYQQADRPYRHAVASNRVISQTPRFMIEVLAMTAIALLAISLGRDGDFSQAVPVLGSLALGANRLLPALQQVFVALAKIQGARASLRNVLIGLKRPIDPMQLWIPKTVLPFENKLRFKDVWFRYSEESDWILKELNLDIKARTTIGFIGSTGSGKSTTADLALGLLKPQKGTIWLDGQPLEGERLRQWQYSTAYVPQSIFLADATILENIAFGTSKDEIDFEQIRKAAKLAQIDKLIESMPAQYETYVGERGIRLSGGQRQRIGIARALYRQASVIVFDEATSALDNETEKEVMAAINGLSHQFTLLMIAHRLSTLERCDKIFELDQGQVINTGTFDDLQLSTRVLKGRK